MNHNSHVNQDSHDITYRDARLSPTAPYESCVFEQLMGDTLRPGGLQITARLAEVAGINNHHTVLDIGCGKGTTSLFLARQYGCRVTGMDLSEKMLSICRSNLAQSETDARVSFVMGDGENLPFPDHSFDIVMAECSFSLMPDKKLAAENIRRILKPGGKLAMADIIIRGDVDRDLQSRIAFPCCFTGARSLEEHLQLFEQAGFKCCHTEDRSEDLLEIGYRLGMMFGGVDDFLDKFPEGPCKTKNIRKHHDKGISFREFLRLSQPGYALMVMIKR